MKFVISDNCFKFVCPLLREHNSSLICNSCTEKAAFRHHAKLHEPGLTCLLILISEDENLGQIHMEYVVYQIPSSQTV